MIDRHAKMYWDGFQVNILRRPDFVWFDEAI